MRGPVLDFCGAIGGYSREAYGTKKSSVYALKKMQMLLSQTPQTLGSEIKFAATQSTI